MAEPLKNNLNKKYVSNLAEEISRVFPSFHSEKFISSTLDKKWKNLELKARLTFICENLFKFLPNDYEQAVAVLLKAAPNFGGFEGMFFPEFISKYGMSNQHHKTSLNALKVLTQYSSSEFAVRPFIVENPTKIMAWMLKLSKDKNYHLRRLASEGCRPRLPWAPALPLFKENPDLIFPILENLKNDPELYVRKSVANNINDICKDNPNPMLAILKKWKKEDPSPEVLWVINHGLRTLIKDGNNHALSLVGFNSSPLINVSKMKLSSRKIALGKNLKIRVELENRSKKGQALLLDYIVYHKKQNGSHAPKVFKWRRVDLRPEEKLTLEKIHKFQKINTRKYYSGQHLIQLQINGKKYPEEKFNLSVID